MDASETHGRPLIMSVKDGLASWGNRRLPFFLEQTTLANVENLHGYLDGTTCTNRCHTHYLGNHDTRTRRYGRSTEGMRQKHTESRWLSRSGIQMHPVCCRKRRPQATP